jgi:hypothetical protein
LFLFDSGRFDGLVHKASSLILFDVLSLAGNGRNAGVPVASSATRAWKARATSARNNEPTYFKELVPFCTRDGKDFVSGKQKRTIFENFLDR